MATNLKESYDLLGLPVDATDEEVRKAYMKKAKECHPDKNPQDPQATEKFQALSEGYERINSSLRTESVDEEYFSGHNDFFHFVIFREMMRRRMREEMLRRMFGGIFDDDIGPEEAHFPFGPFGGPFFNRPRSHESFERWHHSRFQDGRPSSAHETSTKASKKGKQRKKNPRNSSASGPSRDTHEREYSGRRNFSNEETASDRGETIDSNSAEDFCVSSEKETSDNKRDKQRNGSKSKQKNKNKGQMTAAEWQKGRKKNHRKKKTARF